MLSYGMQAGLARTMLAIYSDALHLNADNQFATSVILVLFTHRPNDNKRRHY